MLIDSQHNRHALMHVLYCLEVGIYWEKTRVLQQIETLLLTNQISAFILFIRSLTISYCMCVIPILLINNSGNLHYNWCKVQQIHSSEFRVFCRLRIVLKITTATVAYICDWIWENLASTHDYKHLEVPNLIIWSILTKEGKQMLAWNLPRF